MDPSTLAAMHALVKEQADSEVIFVEPGHVLVTSNARVVHDLDAIAEKHREQPRRPRGTTTHHTLDSLVAHALRHRRPASAAYCDLLADEPRLVVVYNDDPAAEAGPAGGWRDHRAVYAFPLSDAWKRWTDAADRWLDVPTFARLLEDGLADVRGVGPDADVPRVQGVRYASPAELLTLAEGLEVRVEQRVADRRTLDNGTAQLVFEEVHRGERGEPLRVPNGFLLGVPVFVGGPAYALPVRLRYRVANGAVTWLLTLHDADAARREAVSEAAQRFETQAGVALFFGAAG